MDNYYEILEVSKNASKEVIEKAYRVLAKRYHPDLQKENNKKIAEEKMKLINEAYETLSNDEKREKYNIQLKEIERQKYVNENNKYNNEEYYEEQNLSKEEIKQEEILQRQYQEEKERIYRNHLRSLGYRVKEKWTLKKFIKLLKILVIIIIAVLIIWLFPPTNKMIIQIYEENDIIRVIIDTIFKIVQGIGNGILIFLKNLFSK